jgi:hypothetical protein
MLSQPAYTYLQEKTKEGFRPDLLWSLVALAHLMQLSLLKGAHADLSSTAWQEIGVKPGFACPGVPWGLGGRPLHSTHLFCHPSA